MQKSHHFFIQYGSDPASLKRFSTNMYKVYKGIYEIYFLQASKRFGQWKDM